MAKLNLEGFKDKRTAQMECACFLVECLTEDEKKRLKEDWNKAGGRESVSWWKWCLDNISVSYQ